MSLGFVHPITKKNLYFEAPLPADFLTVLQKWEQYVQVD
jgi:23S rRNA pseudouridine1911/1915/1917 synthase